MSLAWLHCAGILILPVTMFIIMLAYIWSSVSRSIHKDCVYVSFNVIWDWYYEAPKMGRCLRKCGEWFKYSTAVYNARLMAGNECCTDNVQSNPQPLIRRYTRPHLNGCLRYDLPNGFTYLQLGRDLINLFLFKYMPF